MSAFSIEHLYISPGHNFFEHHGQLAGSKRPIWGQSIMRKQIHPAMEKLGIKKRIGWHTFRHSYSTLLRHLGTDIKVQQDLLRHSSARLTLDTYAGQARGAKRSRAAHSIARIRTS
jgi:site-specific recombinase XerD